MDALSAMLQNQELSARINSSDRMTVTLFNRAKAIIATFTKLLFGQRLPFQA